MATKSPHLIPTGVEEAIRLDLSLAPAGTPLDELFARACQAAADALEVERVGVWLFIDDRTVLRCAHLFERSKRTHSSGALLRVDQMEAYVGILERRRAIPAVDAWTEGWTSELVDQYLRPLGITSMLDAGVFVDGELVGVICHEQVGSPRQWTQREFDFASSIADFVGARLQSAQVRELRAAFLNQQNRLAARARSAAAEELAAGIGYEIEKLMTVVKSRALALSEWPDISPEARYAADEISLIATRGLALSAELVEFARPLEPTSVVIDLGDAAQAFLPILQGLVGPKHSVRLDRPTQSGRVLMDKTIYTRMLASLVMNAKEAMPLGGHIDVRLSNVKLTGAPSIVGHFIMLVVEDRGVGMPPETQKRMFDPYFTTKSGNRGLGLAVVRQAMDRVGGFMRVHSIVNSGTTVKCFFPSIWATPGEVEDLDPDAVEENVE